MSAVFGALGRVPMPLFGTSRVFATWSKNIATHAPGYVGWAFPALVGAAWFVWPAVDDEWKMSVGLQKDTRPPENAPEAAPAADAPIQLDSAAETAIAEAHKGEPLTHEDIKVIAEVRAGDFSSLEKDWDEFYAKSIIPGEGDDDEDEDEEEEEEEEEEGDDDEGEEYNTQ